MAYAFLTQDRRNADFRHRSRQSCVSQAWRKRLGETRGPRHDMTYQGKIYTDRYLEHRPRKLAARFAGTMTDVRLAAIAGLIAPRDLAVFLSCRFLSTIAMMVQSVAIGWQIYDITHAPLSLGLVGLCEFVPMFLLTLPAGDIVDRLDPRLIFAWRWRRRRLAPVFC